METGVKALLFSFNPKDVFIPTLPRQKPSFPYPITCAAPQRSTREIHNRYCYAPVRAVLAGAEDVGVPSSQFADFSVTTAASSSEAGEFKITVEVFGARTREVFDSVFEKMADAAQPIPGFRRVKGGKTPNIPREILLEILGPSNVYKRVIKKVINSTVAEYVEKEGLEVSKDLRVEQSFEDLEDAFKPGETFSFGVVVKLQQKN